MLRKIKTFLIILVAIAILVSMAGCGGSATNKDADSTSKDTTQTSDSGKQQQTVIKFLHKWPEAERMPYWEDVVARFEKENPDIKIQMEAVADEPIKEKLRVMLGGGSVPDVFFTWAGEFLNKFVKAGAAMDITSYLDKDPEWKNSFIESLLLSGASGGKQYGIPIRVSAKFFIYNLEKFKEAGLEPPKTWDEFINICETFKQKGEIPLLLGNQAPWASCHYLTTFNAKLVPEDVWRKDYQPANGEFTHPGYVEALKLLQDLYNKGYFNDAPNSTTHQQTREMFYTGTGAMIYDEMPNFKLRYETNMPGKWGFFICPPIEGAEGNQNLVTGDPDMFVVSSKCENPEAAIRFLKFVTNMENSQKLCAELGFQSCVKGAVNESNSLPQVIEAMNIIAESDGLTGWLDTAMEASVVDKYLANLQQLFDGKSPEAIISEVQKEAARVAKEYK
ncbi:MAG TPA: extracellular solute-binding protein [Clostridiaceae bacterium]|nr:extracellular solute-binding protein [Clostridiaceae bacterium]